MSYHITAFLLGLVLDLIIGDPHSIPHPVKWIGGLIAKLDRMLLEPVIRSERNAGQEFRRGIVLCAAVLAATGISSFCIVHTAYMMHPYVGIIVESVLTCYILAARSLQVESMKVYTCLKTGTIQESRRAVSMIVGRDTICLDRTGVAKAAVETVAENTSDGVIAPLLYTFIGGPVLGLLYKAVNTMDSMVGYHNDRYEHFGTAAARLDDIVNFVPARLSAVFMTAAAFILGKEYSGKRAWRIFRRDRYNHKSPNSAQTESVCAGALGIRLAGDAVYFGRLVKKPYIGDDDRPVEPEDIPRACALMFATEGITAAVCLAVSLITLLF